MPYASKKQKHFMQAVEHNKKFAEKVGVPQSVGKKFAEDSKRQRPKTAPGPGKK